MAKKSDTGHSFIDYLKRAVNPMLVLALLTEESMYAYQMIQELTKRGNSEYTTSFLYPVLYKLENQGYIENCGKVISEDNRVRSYYKITTSGVEYLEKLKIEYAEMLKSVDKIMCSIKNNPNI